MTARELSKGGSVIHRARQLSTDRFALWIKLWISLSKESRADSRLGTP
jgi:hypothetical protein